MRRWICLSGHIHPDLHHLARDVSSRTREKKAFLRLHLQRTTNQTSDIPAIIEQLNNSLRTGLCVCVCDATSKSFHGGRDTGNGL